ncbi:Scr1 family TA system antitoxin-like transcriptional regulator [Micromonospora sp. NBC_00821]|uniref:Scr1 family TA system antitoxin-like transcriptional regulator n=1 Tax=Micromonospora sp. NBC_00821 TaxID=2975977 RepID=UPI003FA5F034
MGSASNSASQQPGVRAGPRPAVGPAAPRGSQRDGRRPRAAGSDNHGVRPEPLGPWVPLSGPFNLARGADGGWVGHMEHQIDGLVVDGDQEVATLLARWEMIRNGAFSRRQSIELMKEVVTSWT